MEFGEEDKHAIRVWCMAKGTGHFRRTCPSCSDDRQRGKKVSCLSVEVTSDHATFRCWHCEATGAVSFRDRKEPKEQRYYEPLKKQPAAKFSVVREIGTKLDALTSTWLKGRGLSENTALTFGCTFARAFFPEIRKETHAIAFPYYDEKGQVCGHKVRSTEEKANVCAPALYSLFGIQNVDLKESPDIIICEGEPDMLSMFEAGVLNATSVPNGASSFARAEGKDDKAAYGFLWTAKAKIDGAKRILIATDDDDPGHKLAEEMARRIGRHRCWRVSYPEDCKDANDVLRKHGKNELRDRVERAEPWPIDGLHEATRYIGDVFNLFENGMGEKVLVGIPPVDELYSAGKGLLTIITGIPAHGKSTLVDQFMINLAKRYDHTFAICSFENPPDVHIAKLSEMLLQKHFFEGEDRPGTRMNRDELELVVPFIVNHFKFLSQDDGRKASLESIIERIKTAVFRWGINGAVIDPYNYISRPKDADFETVWIDDMLTQLRLLAVAHDLHLWFVAHPTKMQMDGEGKYPPPRGYSISGSSAWYAKADFGLTIYREQSKPGVVRLINWKTRFDWLGQEGEREFLYDNQTNTYLSSAIDLPYSNYHDASRGGDEKPW